jgi:hypothetical protein
MQSRKKRKLRFGGASLALGSAVLVVSTFLSEGSLRWVCRGVALALIMLAGWHFVGANAETD